MLKFSDFRRSRNFRFAKTFLLHFFCLSFFYDPSWRCQCTKTLVAGSIGLCQSHAWQSRAGVWAWTGPCLDRSLPRALVRSFCSVKQRGTLRRVRLYCSVHPVRQCNQFEQGERRFMKQWDQHQRKRQLSGRSMNQ